MANPATTAPKAPTTPVAAEAKPKKERKVWKSLFDSADAAVKEATSRTGGPRRAFHVKFNGKDYYVVTHNPTTVGTPVLEHLGGTAQEIGKPTRATKVPTADAILSMLKDLPEEERKKVEAQMGSLLGHHKK